MRKRLIKLLKQAEKQQILNAVCGDIDSLIDSPRGAEFIADHLLANGVIVPPCKVGDVVYVVKPYVSSVQEYQVRGYRLGEFPTLNGHRRKSYLICYHKASSALKHLPIDEIGKTVFFFREEAEKTLKGSD